MKGLAEQIARWRDRTLLMEQVEKGELTLFMARYLLDMEGAYLRGETLQRFLTSPQEKIRQVGWEYLQRKGGKELKMADFGGLLSVLEEERNPWVLDLMLEWRPADGVERAMWREGCRRRLTREGMMMMSYEDVKSGFLCHVQRIEAEYRAAGVALPAGNRAEKQKGRGDAFWWERRAWWQATGRHDWDSPEWVSGLKQAIREEKHPAVLEALIEVWPERVTQQVDIWREWLSCLTREEWMRNKEYWAWKALLKRVPPGQDEKLMQLISQEMIESKNRTVMKMLSSWRPESAEWRKRMSDFWDTYLNEDSEEKEITIADMVKEDLAWQGRFRLAESKREKLDVLRECLKKNQAIGQNITGWMLEQDTETIRKEIWEIVEKYRLMLGVVYWEVFPALCPDPESCLGIFLETLTMVTDEIRHAATNHAVDYADKMNMLWVLGQWVPENPETRARVMLAWAEQAGQTCLGGLNWTHSLCLTNAIRLRDSFAGNLPDGYEGKYWKILMGMWEKVHDDQTWEMLALELGRMTAGNGERQQAWWGGLQAAGSGKQGSVVRQRKAGWIQDEFLSRQCEQWCRQYPEQDAAGILRFGRQLKQMFPAISHGKWQKVRMAFGTDGELEIEERETNVENRRKGFEVQPGGGAGEWFSLSPSEAGRAGEGGNEALSAGQKDSGKSREQHEPGPMSVRMGW